jgi:hypothetical protein
MSGFRRLQWQSYWQTTPPSDHLVGRGQDGTSIHLCDAWWRQVHVPAGSVGGAGAEQFVFIAISDSTVASHDTISDFVHGADIIDTAAISGVTTVQGLISGSIQVAAHSIAWIQSGANTIVYFNNSTVAQNQGSADMEVVLTSVTANSLTSQDFFHF